MNSIARSLESWHRYLRRENALRAGREAQRNMILRFLVISIFLAPLTDPERLNARFHVGVVDTIQVAAKATQPALFRSVGKGYRSGVRYPLQIVARSQSEWDAIWQQHVLGDAGSRPPPAIDFEKEIVVALFLGDKPTGGHDVRISRAEQSHDTVTIHYQERIPPPGSIVTQALTQPFHIVRIIGDVNSQVVFRRDS